MRFGPNGSVPASLRPACEATARISGNRFRVWRMWAAIWALFSSEVPGGRLERIQMVPSSSVGRNSEPRLPPSRNAR